MKKLNNKGFVMAETLVVAVFIMGLFSVMYNNFFPLIGEYEKREVYDDIDSKYGAFWIKRFIQHSSFTLSSSMINELNVNKYTYINCNPISDSYRKMMCEKLLRELEVKDYARKPRIYLTSYRLDEFKKVVSNDKNFVTFSGGFAEYVNYLPNYTKGSANRAGYRILVEFDREKNGTHYTSFGTIEVKK